MLKDKMVCVRFVRRFHEDPNWAIAGKCVQFSDIWLVVDGKTIMVTRGRHRTVEVDTQLRRLVIARENVMNIEVLPDGFGLKALSVEHVGVTGSKMTMSVEGAIDCVVGEAMD